MGVRNWLMDIIIRVVPQKPRSNMIEIDQIGHTVRAIALDPELLEVKTSALSKRLLRHY